MNLGPGIELADAAFVALVVRAAQSVEGVRVRRPRKLELDGARLGLVLPELARDVQARVHEAVETMCGIRLAGVDVTIEVLDT